MESILLLSNKKKLPLPYIYIIILILAIGIYYLGILNEEIQEIGFLFFGIPILYTSLIFGKQKGFIITLLSLISWLIGTSNHIIKEITKNDWESILSEGILLSSSFYLGCLVLSAAILKERNILIKYRELANELNIQNQTLKKQHIGIIKTLTRTIDAKDSYTCGHSERVACYALAVAKEVGLNAKEQRDIFYAGALHDIGKIGINDNVLCKPSKLSSAEMDLIKNHPSIGANILTELEDLEDVKSFIFSHHERFGGYGYPLGIKGSEIPLAARIIAVVDTYDAIMSQRNYKRDKNLSKEEALEEIKANTPNQFDPDIVKIFVYLIHSGKINVSFIDSLNSLKF